MNLIHRYLARIVPEKGTIFEVPVYADSEREAMVTVRNLLEHRNGTEKFIIDLVRHERWADPERG